MSFCAWLTAPRTRLDVAAGTVDGILNAVILASGRLLKLNDGTSISFALRVGIASSLTTLFVFFVAHYAELRSDLVRVERELNLTSHGHLASSRLGARAIRESLSQAVLAAVCGFVGAAFPLVLTAVLPGPRWLGLCITIGLLGLLGMMLARSFYGSMLTWAIVIMLGGALLVAAGAWLNVVQ